MSKFRDAWPDLEHLRTEWEPKKSEPFPDTIDDVLFSHYESDQYEGDGKVIFRKDGVMYEVDGSHCSCNGLERQWHPGTITLEALKLRVPELRANIHDNYSNERSQLMLEFIEALEKGEL